MPANTGVHTNGVESNWCAGKTTIKDMRGISRDYLQSYLDEFCWRKLFKDDFEVFNKILQQIAKQYPVESEPNIDQIISNVTALSINDACIFHVDDDDDDDIVPSLPDHEDDSVHVESQPIAESQPIVESQPSDESQAVVESQPIVDKELNTVTLTLSQLISQTFEKF